MIKVYKSESEEWDGITIINTETSNIKMYRVAKEGYVIGDIWSKNVNDLGYNNLTECIKILKNRNFLGAEINYKDQKESERLGYIQLGIERIKLNNRVNTKDFEDVIQKLAAYGMNFVDAQNTIIGNYEYQYCN